MTTRETFEKEVRKTIVGSSLAGDGIDEVVDQVMPQILAAYDKAMGEVIGDRSTVDRSVCHCAGTHWCRAVIRNDLRDEQRQRAGVE